MNVTAEKIIETGIDLISKKGYNNVGLSEILSVSNIPKGSFYYYFKSKEDFGLQVIGAYSENTLVFLNKRLLDTALPAKENLISFFTDMANVYSLKGYKEGCLLGNSSLELSDGYEKLAIKISGELNKWQSVFEHCIEVGQADGSINNHFVPKTLANFILNSWEGTLLRMKADKNEEALNAFISTIAEIL